MNGWTPPHALIEPVRITAPLAMKFRDAATLALMSDGLLAAAYPANDPRRRVNAARNSSGAIVFHHLPGLREFENGGGAPAWPAPRRYVVEVSDPAGRYIASRIEVTAPARGLWRFPQMDSPLDEADGAAPLFSAPTRSVPSGFGVVRALLKHAGSGAPVAWAWAEARVRTGRGPQPRVARGLADAAGALTLLVAYPAPASLSLGSPLASGPRLLSEQRWTVAVQVWASRTPGPPEFAPLLELAELRHRAPDYLWEEASPGTPFFEAQMMFGRELILPERGAGDTRPRELYLTPAGSPP